MDTPFVWGEGGEAVSQDALARRRKLAEALMLKGADTSPVQSWTQGAARVAQTLAGLMQNKYANEDEQTTNKSWMDALGGVTGNSSPSPVASALGGGGGGDLSSAADAIAKIESGGRYNATGPVTKNGDRAYGKYQVMGNNIPQWTKEALGQEMTPEQFVASPQAQDAVFKHRFGGYLDKTGSPSDAASMWFTGRPLADGASRKDVLGTSGSQYVSRFLSAYNPQGGQPQGQPNALAFSGQTANDGPQPGIGQPQDQTSPNGMVLPQQSPQAAPQPKGMLGLGAAAPQPAAPAGPDAGMQNKLLAIIANPMAPPTVRAAAQAKLQMITKDPNQELQRQVLQGQIAAQPYELQGKQLQNAKTAAELPNVGVPEAVQKLHAAGFDDNRIRAIANDPNHPMHGQIMNAIAGGGVNVSVNNQQESEQAKVVGKAVGDRQVATENAYQTAPEKLQKIQLFKTLLNGVQTGALAGTNARIADVALGLGISPDTLKAVGLDPNMPATEQSLQSAVASATVGMIGKGGFPANNFSDADRKFLMGTNVQLSNRPEANALILEVQQRTAQRELEAADSWAKAQEAGVKYPEWERQWARKSASENIFADLKPQADALLKKPGTGGPQGGSGQALQQAKDAISRGAPRDKVIQRLRENGIDPAGL